MKSLYIATSVITSLVLSGCLTLPIVDKDSFPPSQDESIIVFGVSPDRYAVGFFPGSIEQGKFRENPLKSGVMAGGGSDPYIVARVKAGQTIALTRVSDTRPEKVFARNGWGTCGGHLTPVIEVPRGQVIYAGSLEILRNDSSIAFELTTKLEQAVEHLRKNYPRLANDLQLQPAQLILTDRCPSTTFVLPIPVGR